MTVAVGIDVGTTGVKAVAITPDGAVVASAEHHYPLAFPQPGWAEQDPESWWRAAELALGEVTSGRSVAGIGLTGQMHGLVCLDDADDVIRPAILWNDQRTAEQCQALDDRLGRDTLIALTGNRPFPGFTAPKLLWLREHEPESCARIARICLPKDYVRLRLTGELVTDVTDASGTLLLDVAHRTWSERLLDALEIDPAWLPKVVESAEISGLTGEGVPVAAGAGDCAAAALGVGVIEPGPISLVLGTSGVVFATLPAYVTDAQARLHVFCHAAPERWHAMGVMLSAAGSLQWLHDVVAPQLPVADLLVEAARWPAGAEGLCFLPYLQGERTPHADADARGAFTGLSSRHDRGALARAVLEGVAFGLRDSLELLRGIGVKPVTARASGGGARSDLWLRICASVLDLPIERVAVDDGSAYGAALLGAVAGGLYPSVDAAATATVRVTETIEPDANWRGSYDEIYPRYRSLYPALKAIQ